MRQRLTGSERALLYRFAFETGIRPKQIRALKVSSFDLKSDPATVTSEARSTKRRRIHVQVIRPAGMGQRGCDGRREDRTGQERFPGRTESPERMGSLLSTRHGHGTALADAGVPEKEIAASMHHASRKTTARYLHTNREAVASAIAALPDLSYPMADVATGTDNQSCFTTALPLKNFSMESGGVGSQNHRDHDSAESLGKTGESAISDEKLKFGLLAELADALDSKSNARKGVSVRLR